MPERRGKDITGRRNSVNEHTEEGTSAPSVKGGELWVKQMGWSRSNGIPENTFDYKV